MNHPVVVDATVLMSLQPPKWLAVCLYEAWKEACLAHPGKTYGAMVTIMKARIAKG